MGVSRGWCASRGEPRPTSWPGHRLVIKAALVEVIPFHLEGLQAGGDALPGTVVEWVEV